MSVGHIPDPVAVHARERGADVAVEAANVRWTWRDVDARVEATARRIVEHPSARVAGSPRRIGVIARPDPNLVVLVLAALRASAVMVPISPRWPQAMVDAAAKTLALDLLLSESTEQAAPRLADWTSPDGSTPAESIAEIALDAPFTIVHTSGSAGRPKAALHTVGNHVASALGLLERMPLLPGDRWLLNLSVAHVGGLGVVVRCALAGATMVLSEEGQALADEVQRLRPTHVSLVAPQLNSLVADPRPTPFLKAILLGGGPIPDALVRRAVDNGFPVWTSYGLTEMTSTVSATPADPHSITSGTVLPQRELRIGAAGVIEVRGDTLFAGYLESGRLHRPLTPDGWFPTGDVGHLRPDGSLVVTGRADRQFVSGGENIHPEAIEAALSRLVEVAEAVVVPVADRQFGQRPFAFVRVAPGYPFDTVRLASRLRDSLPGYMIPVNFCEWTGAVGMKPDLVSLQAEAERART